MGLEKILAGALKKMGFGKFSTYPLIGVLPGEFQNKLAGDVGFRPWIPTVGNMALCLGINLGTWYLGDNLNGDTADYFGMGIKGLLICVRVET